MNIYLLKLIINWLGILFLSILSLFETNIKENIIKIENTTIDKNAAVISKVKEYTTITKYNSKIPYGEINVLVEGSNGINYIDSNGVEQQLRPVIDRVVEYGTGASGNYVGNTTGYGADCIGCSGTVACKTREGINHNLVKDGMYYNDSQYGKVRILAADHRVFRCGTIIKVDNGREEPFIGIVLDTGIDMRRNWEFYGLIHLDVAFVTEKDPAVYSMTASNQSAKFEVKRWGW